jgi:PIN domain nuclease of toxin-antitoxin system
MSSSRLLLDTHIWFWYLSGSTKLNQAMRLSIDQHHEACFLSPISVWELGMLDKKNRLHLKGGFHSWLEQARAVFPVQDATLTAAVAAKCHQLSLATQDPTDHFIAATAIVYHLRLMTADQHLLAAAQVPTWSSDN